MPEGGGRESVQAFDSDTSTCAHFLWLESNWVLNRSRPGPTDLTRPIDPRLGALCADLEKLITWLRSAGENHWSEWLEQDLKRIRARDAGGITHLLSAFGGMGSFSDLMLDQRNGHKVADTSKGFVNDRLAHLRSSVFELAQALQRAR